MVGLPFLPRSPRWFTKVAGPDEAIRILAKIHATGNIKNRLVIAKCDETTKILALGRAAAPGRRKFIVNGMWKRTLAVFTVQLSRYELFTPVSQCMVQNDTMTSTIVEQQNSGPDVKTYYAVYIFSLLN